MKHPETTLDIPLNFAPTKAPVRARRTRTKELCYPPRYDVHFTTSEGDAEELRKLIGERLNKKFGRSRLFMNVGKITDEIEVASITVNEVPAWPKQ